MCTLLRGLRAAAALLALQGSLLAAQGEDADCLRCHKDYTPVALAKTGQPLPCARCHAGTDAAVTPHLNRSAFANGLSAGGAASCLACHDKDDYVKTNHGTLGAGCTGCHGAHAARHGQLLRSETAALCFTCHKSTDFEGRVTHKPVAQGDCADCHAMHASEHPALLSDPLNETCNACHGKVRKKPHAVTGFSNRGHPLGLDKTRLADPSRPGRPFYCGSCHDPHRSAARRLLRHGDSSMTGLCQACHRK